MFYGCFGNYTVYSVKQTPNSTTKGGIFYALPKTEICVDVSFSHYDTSNAPFASFAEEMLAIDLSENDFTIDDITISTHVVADPDRYYFVNPKGLAIQVDSRNLLRSIGIECTVAANSQALDTIKRPTPTSFNVPPTYNLYDRHDTLYARNDKPGHPSFVATNKDSRNLRQRAEAAAEKIGALQERRNELSNGDVEGNYTPEMIKYQIQQIDQLETELVSQFVGASTTETVRFIVTPTDEKALIDDQTVLLFYYSPQKGIADSNDIDAVPVNCNIRCANNMRNAARFIRYHIKRNENPDNSKLFKYRRSEQANVTVYSDYFRYQQQVPVAQFGPIIEMPKGKFKALFDEHTGDLIYFSNER